MVPNKEWKELMDHAKDKALRKQRKNRPLGSRRYDTYHISMKNVHFFNF